ncbi:Protein Wnt-8b, partial [Clarias magur]
ASHVCKMDRRGKNRTDAQNRKRKKENGKQCLKMRTAMSKWIKRDCANEITSLFSKYNHFNALYMSAHKKDEKDEEYREKANKSRAGEENSHEDEEDNEAMIEKELSAGEEN